VLTNYFLVRALQALKFSSLLTLLTTLARLRSRDLVRDASSDGIFERLFAMLS